MKDDLTLWMKERRNIYTFIDKIHNLLYGKEGLGGMDAVKGALPILAYILHKGRRKPETMKRISDNMLSDINKAKADIALFIAREVEPKLKEPKLKQFFESVRNTVQNLTPTTFQKFLERVKKEEVLNALTKEDIVGALFEKMVYNEFKGGGGKYLTHRNLVITMREISWSLFEKEKKELREITVYDPCAGSARFLTFWLDKIKNTYNISSVEDYAKQHLFGTDKFPEMIGLSALNMLLHGNGIVNIFRADATDHFGFLTDFGNVIHFLKTFTEKWKTIKPRIRAFRREIAEELQRYENDVHKFAEQIFQALKEGREIKIDMNSPEIEALYKFVYASKNLPLELQRKLKLEDLIRRSELPCIHFLIKYIWSQNNPKIKEGFNLILTNPPMGRTGRGGRGKEELQITDKFILCQYSLANQIWLPATSVKLLRTLANKLGVKLPKKVAKDKLVQELIKKLGKEWISPEDLGLYTYKVVLIDKSLDFEHSVYYDKNYQPVVFPNSLPIQVVMLEQFWRVVKPNGGKVFTVIDVGVLNNPGDEFIRRLLFTRLAKINAIIELPHGAFTYCGAGTKTALLFYERCKNMPTDYDFFIALAENIGYDTRSKEATPLAENDFGKIICEINKLLGHSIKCEKCTWEENKSCYWWITNFEVV